VNIYIKHHLANISVATFILTSISIQIRYIYDLQNNFIASHNCFYLTRTPPSVAE
jgi:hypothetical protein